MLVSERMKHPLWRFSSPAASVYGDLTPVANFTFWKKAYWAGNPFQTFWLFAIVHYSKTNSLQNNKITSETSVPTGIHQSMRLSARHERSRISWVKLIPVTLTCLCSLGKTKYSVSHFQIYLRQFTSRNNYIFQYWMPQDTVVSRKV